MELIVKKQFKQFEGILDVGDKVHLELTYYKKDTVIHNGSEPIEKQAKNIRPFIEKFYAKFDKVVAKKGELDGGYRIHAKNGKAYDEGCIRNMIGYKPLGDIFEKLN